MLKVLSIKSKDCGVEKIYEDGSGEATAQIAQIMCDILNISPTSRSFGEFLVNNDKQLGRVEVILRHQHWYLKGHNCSSCDEWSRVSAKVASSNVSDNKKHGTFLFAVELPNWFWPQFRQIQVLLPFNVATGPNKVIIDDHPRAQSLTKEHDDYLMNNASLVIR